MKYIMIETEDGAKLPFIFPESCTHSIVSEFVRMMLLRFHATEATTVVSAGFVSLGNDVSVHGESESLAGLKSNPTDASRIMIGESVQFMPDEMAELMLTKLKEMNDG